MNAAGVDIHEPGGWLGHYTTAATAFEHILPSGQLRLSPYSLMRDPAENKDLIPSTAFAGDRPTATEDWGATVFAINEYRDRVRLLSLTADVVGMDSRHKRFGSCWARPRMWEHYAEAHRGVCLVFDQAALVSAVEAAFGEQVVVGRVEYTPAGIAGSEMHTIVDERIFDSDLRANAVRDYVEKNQHDLFFLKTDDWQSEHEFRAALLEVDTDYAFVDHEQSLRAIVVGERFPEWQLSGVRELCDKAGVELHKAFWDHEGRPFAPRPRPVED